MATARILRLVLAVVVVWYVLALLLWAIQPLTGYVPVGTDFTSNPPADTTVEVHCNNLFDQNPGDGGDLPELPQQPEGQPPLAPPAEPCAALHADARRTFAIDTIVFVLVLAGVAAYSIRLRRVGNDHV